MCISTNVRVTILQVDIIFVSWVWCPEMITNVREQLRDMKSKIRVIAKIENYEGLKRCLLFFSFFILVHGKIRHFLNMKTEFSLNKQILKLDVS